MQAIVDFSLVDFQVIDESGVAIGDIRYGFVEDDLEYACVVMLEDDEQVNVPVYLFKHFDIHNMTVTLESELV
jgi:hypothetical protein